MKKILITGAGSYIGGSVEGYLARWPEDYQVDTLNVRGEEWKNTSFQGYNAVLHVAGIVHQKKTKDDPACWEQYRQVNVDLAVETARKAKAEGVGQFLFMSSESVYGLSAPLGKQVVITRETPLHPVDNYGRSKAQAEAELEKLSGEDFRLAILRPPIVYGKGCRGNYVTLAKLAKKLPVFPKVEADSRPGGGGFLPPKQRVCQYQRCGQPDFPRPREEPDSGGGDNLGPETAEPGDAFGGQGFRQPVL